MKKITSLLIGLIIVFSCQAKKEQLELNLSVGTIYPQLFTVNSNIVQTINGQQVTINMTLNSRMTYKVLDLQNSLYNLEVNYESLEMKMGLPNGVMEYSSEKNDENDVLSSVLAALKNKPFLVTMTKTGKVNEVKNIEWIFASMFDKIPPLSEEQKQQIKSQIMQAYGENAFKGNIEMCSAIFPDSPVSKGDKWTIHTQLESGMYAKIETEYELKEITDSDCLIMGHSTFKTEDKDTTIQTNGMSLKYDLAGTMISDIKIDRNSGWIQYAKINQSISGTAYVKSNPQIPDGMTLPMTINNVMILTDK